MKHINININNPCKTAIKKAASVLDKGGIVVYPTDTAYGLGVNAFDDKAVAKLYKIKLRNNTNPTHVICRDWKMISQICKTNMHAKILHNRYFPGPLTIVLTKKEGSKISPLLSGNLSTVGVRIPNCKVTQEISKCFPFPYTTPSANRTGDKTPYCIDDFYRSLVKENVDLFLDAGKLPEKPTSTIVSLVGNKIEILRDGGIPEKKILSLQSS